MRSALLLGVILGLSLAGVAQEVPAQLSPAEVRALIDRVSSLEKRVAELEAKQPATLQQAASVVPAAATARADAPAQQSSRPAPYEDSAHQHKPELQAQMQEADTFPTLKIRGFADVDFSSSDQAGNVSGFSMGQFVLHF